MSFLCGVTDGSDASLSVVNHCEDSELSGQLRIKIFAALNLGYDEWPNFLGNRHMVEALLSRLRHYCHTVNINGPSLREPQG